MKPAMICLAAAVLAAAFTATAAAGETKVSVAIPSFKIMAANPDNDWLGPAFSDAMTSKLANVSRLKVVERARLDDIMSEMELAQSGLVDSKYVEFARLSGAQFLVLGSCQAMGEKGSMALKVYARAVDAGTGQVVQGQVAEASGSLKDVFDIQDKLAMRVAVNLNIEVPPEEQKKMTIRETSSVAAYELYWVANGEKDPHRKIEILRKAIAYDPGYSRAYLALASTLFIISANQPENPEIESLALKAIELDPALADAYNVAGTYLGRVAFNMYKAQSPEAKRVAQKAIRCYTRFIEMKGGDDAKYYKFQVGRAKREIESLSKY